MSRTTSTLVTAAAALAATAVIAACGSSSPSSSSATGSGDASTPAQRQQMEQAAVHFADCMRSHGISDFPDPSTSPREFKNALETKSPAFNAALRACQHLLPGGGHRNRGESPRSQAEKAAILAFARCLRSHGFPNFPDPTPSGDVTHEMLAAAGINLHQPAVVRAGDACVGVTHGLITQADVARFVAGH
jgi:hypothetical protein